MYTHTARPRFSLFDELDRGLNHFVNGVLQQNQESSVAPPMTVYALDETIVIECDVPGVVLEDIEVGIEDFVLKISGERRRSVSDNARVTIDERPRERFERQLKLNSDIDPESVDAELGNGVLKITLQKAANARPKKISIRKAGDSQ